MSSNTPRTDAHRLTPAARSAPKDVVDADFACELEHDLADARNAAIELAHKASQAEVQLAAARDGLSHIERVASQGMAPTRRLDWIAHRAKVALRGEKWEPGMREEPRDSKTKLMADFAALRQRNEELKALLQDMLAQEHTAVWQWKGRIDRELEKL